MLLDEVDELVERRDHGTIFPWLRGADAAAGATRVDRPIVATPTWAKLIGFETTPPTAVEEPLRRRAERRGARDRFIAGRAAGGRGNVPSTVVRPEEVSTVNVVAMWVLPIPVTVGRLR
ncbi:hypothetical protein ACQP2P_32185 [Dactylosporangium sp. CA-139114]|uniref:hypothetical protein n=1 Tax=Dactylosporangium sp. CA-139114 TaxID=3239931 RepID=UPI003D99DE7D